MKRMAVCSIEADQFIRAKQVVNISVKALRVKFDEVLPPAILRSKLSQYESCIKKHLTGKQRDKLFPTKGIVSSKTMDLTLMVKVLRNKNIIQTKKTVLDDVARLKNIRNQFAHTTVHELNGQEYEEITQSLIEVIKTFSGSLFDNEIRCTMEESLDYRAGHLTWHVHAAIALAPNAMNETVIKPTKASVVQLYEHQPLHYSIYGGTVLVYGLKNIFEIQSLEELIYYLSVAQDFTVRQCIFILHEHSILKQKLAELLLDQRKQNHLPNYIKPVDVKIEANTTIPVDVPALKSTPTSDLPGIHSQCGHVKLLCKNHPIRNCKLSEQENSISYSYDINFFGSQNSTTKIKHKIECDNFSGSNFENNFDAQCQHEIQSKFPSCRQLSSNNTVSNCKPYMKNGEMYLLHCTEYFETASISNKYCAKVTTYYPGNTVRPNVCHNNASQPYLNGNDNGVIPRGKNVEHVEEKASANKESGNTNINLIIWYVCIVSILYCFPRFHDYFKSWFIAAILIVLTVIFEVWFLNVFFEESKCVVDTYRISCL